MPRIFLHNHPQFGDLIRIVATNEGITSALVERDLDLQSISER
jgi:hypothetical protein